MSFQGVEFTPEMRKMVVNVKHFFDTNKKTSGNFAQIPASKLTASALDISESTVKVIMAAFNKQGDDGLNFSNFPQRGRPSYSLETGVEPLVRQFIRRANRSGDQVNVEIIRNFMQDELHCKDIAHTTLWRALQRWGFEFGKGTRSAQLKESERIVMMRRQYLRLKRSNRDTKGIDRPEVYLDESYINKNHSNDNTWYLEKDGVILGKPTGKGERLVIVNAITNDGWVPCSKLVFKASKKTGDYHANMNWNNFSKWFQGQLLKNIPENSLIIMDNAAYHNVLAEEAFPKRGHSAKRLREWLSDNQYPWTKDMLKSELFDLCSRLAPKPEFLIDNIARKHGHTILRTPPYHPELQPIETCWAIVKNHVAQHNDCTMKKVKVLLEEGFAKVTAKTCQKLIKKINCQEDAFWEEDTEKAS